MRPGDTPRMMLLHHAKLLVSAIVTLVLVGCTMGEATFPSVTPGLPIDRSVGTVALVPDPIPHTLEGREECFACHSIGAVDAPPIPNGHEQDETSCTSCHAVWLAPVVAAAAPPAISHELEMRDDCLMCHKLGTAGAPRIPNNHTGLTSALCLTCHTTVDEIVGAGEGSGSPSSDVPSIPHGVEGFGSCTQCHAEGGDGVPRMPDDHAGRTDDLCSACHEPAAESEEAMPTAAPVVAATETAPSADGDIANGQDVYAASCAPCHGPEGEGTAIAPDALNDPALLTILTDQDLTTAIQQGVEGKMRAFPDLSEQEVLDLVALLRSWQ